MGFIKIFRKYMMNNGHLPKISILLQFGDEILALSCYSVFVLNGLEPRQNYKDLYGVTEAWKGVISYPHIATILIFGKRPFFIMYLRNISVNPIIS